MYVCMEVCVEVWRYARMEVHVCMYGDMYVWRHGDVNVWRYVLRYVRMYVWRYVWGYGGICLTSFVYASYGHMHVGLTVVYNVLRTHRNVMLFNLVFSLL